MARIICYTPLFSSTIGVVLAINETNHVLLEYLMLSLSIRLGLKIKSCLIQNQVKPLLPFCIRIRKIPLVWSYSLRKFTARGLKFM